MSKRRVILTSREKNKFRATSRWKIWRKYLIDKRGRICEVCGTFIRHPQVHHIDEEHYTDLKESKFILVCKCCHEQISRLERIKPENYGKYNQDWVLFYGRFLEKAQSFLRSQETSGIITSVQM